MYLEPIEFALKNGKKAIIRTSLPEDAASMVEYLNVTTAETPYLARCPEDCDRYTVEDEIKVFESAVKADNRLMLVCVLDGKVIAAVITREDMAEYGAESKHLEGIVQQLRDTTGVEVAVFLYELEDGDFKGSTRASGDVDLTVITGAYGGGGHKKAVPQR